MNYCDRTLFIKDDFTTTNYDKVLMKQTKNQYLQFCRSKTDCPCRIQNLL